MHWVAVYLDPEKPVRAEDIDTFRDILSARLEDLIGPGKGGNCPHRKRLHQSGSGVMRPPLSPE